MKLFINISKSFMQKERRYRVHYILNPTYYLQVDFKKGSDSQRHLGWKYDASYTINFDKITKWDNMLSNLPYKKWILMTQYLMKFFTTKPYYLLHVLYADTLSIEEEKEACNICKEYDIDDNTLLMAAIEIDFILKKYFAYRMKVHQPVGYIRPKKIIYFNFYIYCKCDFQRQKVRFLICEDNILKHNYDAPLLALRYEATPKNPILANIIYRLKDNKYDEIFYRWMEQILESHCYVTRIDGMHYLHQKKLDTIIEQHNKTTLIENNLSTEQFMIVVGIIGQISKYLTKAFNKLQKTKDLLRNSDTLEHPDLMKNPSTMLLFPMRPTKN